MVDRLKQSLEHIEPPTCPNCHVDMKWYRSALVAHDPTMIEHVFGCPICQRLAEIKTAVRHDPTPPPRKLSAPRLRWRSAA